MSDDLRNVYIKDEPNCGLVEIQPEYVYMRIPAEYVCIYHKILVLFAEFGIDMLDDCNASCKDVNKNIINCFNMFNAAIAARQLGNFKLANNLIKYIESQLNIDYKELANLDSIIFPVDEQGKIKAIVGCGEKPTFWVDVETGKLWEKSSPNIKDVFSLSEYDESPDTE